MSGLTNFRLRSRFSDHPFSSFLLAVASLLSLTGCVSTDLAPISIQGAAFDPLPDELDLWHAAREEESLMLNEVDIYEDPALEEYLEQLVLRLESPGMAANREVRIQVTVIDDPAFVAFAYPHGSIYMHSGVLAHAQNEDEIAAILAHEIVHVEHRHMARHERARWNRRFPIEALAMGLSIALTLDETDDCEEVFYEEEDDLSDDVFKFGLDLASRVTARGYGQRLEREADDGMIQKLRAGGYDVAKALAFYDRLERLADLGRSPEARDYGLVHGLGSDMAKRLRALADPADLEVSANASSGTILTPPELARLLRGVPRDDAGVTSSELGR